VTGASIRLQQCPGRNWSAQLSWHIIKHGEKQHRLGCFDDEREAARAFDMAARQLQGDAAHSEKVGTKRLRLNFPTEEEVKRAKEKGMLQTDEDRAAARRGRTRRTILDRQLASPELPERAGGGASQGSRRTNTTLQHASVESFEPAVVQFQ
jgi:hypothetical protein